MRDACARHRARCRPARMSFCAAIRSALAPVAIPSRGAALPSYRSRCRFSTISARSSCERALFRAAMAAMKSFCGCTTSGLSISNSGSPRFTMSPTLAISRIDAAGKRRQHRRAGVVVEGDLADCAFLHPERIKLHLGDVQLMHLVRGHPHVAVLRRFLRGDLGDRDSAAEHPGYRDEERRADAGQHRRARLRLEVAGLRSLAGPAGGGFMGTRHLESAAKTIWQYCVRRPIKVLPASRQCTHPASGATKIAGHGAQPSDGVPLAGIDLVAAFLPYSCKLCINAPPRH